MALWQGRGLYAFRHKHIFGFSCLLPGLVSLGCWCRSRQKGAYSQNVLLRLNRTTNSTGDHSNWYAWIACMRLLCRSCPEQQATHSPRFGVGAEVRTCQRTDILPCMQNVKWCNPRCTPDRACRQVLVCAVLGRDLTYSLDLVPNMGR